MRKTSQPCSSLDSQSRAIFHERPQPKVSLSLESFLTLWLPLTADVPDYPIHEFLRSYKNSTIPIQSMRDASGCNGRSIESKFHDDLAVMNPFRGVSKFTCQILSKIIRLYSSQTLMHRII